MTSNSGEGFCIFPHLLNVLVVGFDGSFVKKTCFKKKSTMLRKSFVSQVPLDVLKEVTNS